MTIRMFLPTAGALGLLLTLASTSCGTPKTDCASTCKGCCSANGTCDAFGDSLQRCGRNGALCTTCGTGQTCSTSGSCSGSGGGAGGAGGGSVACSQENCAGCCDAAGACQTGLSPTACGYGGTCAVCVGAQTCVGLGRPTCTNTSCTNGCSGANGACETTLSDTKCGANGVACFSCAANGATCAVATGTCAGGVCGGCRDTSGVCKPGTTKGYCGSGGTQCATCGTGQICVNAQCITGGVGGGAGGGAGGGTGGGSGGGAAGGAGGGTGGGTGGAGGGFPTDVIPDPGTAMGAEWTDIEPNDRPAQAVKVGVLQTVWAGFVMPFTTINSATDKDFFVFRTGTATQLQSSSLLLCWSGMFNLLDMYLYSVDPQQHQGPLVKSWTATTAGCETAFQGNGADAGLTPNTVYLLEVRAAPGAVTPTQYNA